MLTTEKAREFCGGGSHDLSEDEENRYAEEIAVAANSYARFLETRDFREWLAPAEVTVDGETTMMDVDRPTAVSVPEDFEPKKKKSKKGGDK